jgi:hypothetical protein
MFLLEYVIISKISLMFRNWRSSDSGLQFVTRRIQNYSYNSCDFNANVRNKQTRLLILYQSVIIFLYSQESYFNIYVIQQGTQYLMINFIHNIR